jgi:alginate O-acetyltransferase complex protein AlgI
MQGRYRNQFLLVVSLFFFAWGGVLYTFLFIGSILLNFIGGILIARQPAVSLQRKLIFALIVVLNLWLLCYFKYGQFIMENLNILYAKFKMKPSPVHTILLPIGISFYTFHGLSYITDVYRGTTQPQRKLTDLGLYMSFFPQLIAGPIVRYKDVSDQITNRSLSAKMFNSGMYRFIIGLGKKVFIANTLALLADNCFSIPSKELEMTTAWIGIAAYTFQIYFDFSGYSDMAIGLAQCFGFKFKENFNFPYLAESIKDFWRRWHISLSSWFKDYVYIPLGGNKNGKLKTYRNLIIVFFLTGLWHGASWNFIIWGFFHGFFIVIETVFLGKYLEKLWKPLRVIYCFALVMFGWVLFRVEKFADAMNYYKVMFGITKGKALPPDLWKIINNEQLTAFVIAIAGSFGLMKIFNDFDSEKERVISPVAQYSIDAGKLFFSIFVIVVCTFYMVAGTYNPFIYFRF